MTPEERARERGIDLATVTDEFLEAIRSRQSSSRFGRELFRLTDAEIDVRLGKGLSPQEDEVMLLTASGYSSKDIATALELGFETVKEYKKRAFHKLAAVNAPHAVAVWFLRQVREGK